MRNKMAMEHSKANGHRPRFEPAEKAERPPKLLYGKKTNDLLSELDKVLNSPPIVPGNVYHKKRQEKVQKLVGENIGNLSLQEKNLVVKKYYEVCQKHDLEFVITEKNLQGVDFKGFKLKGANFSLSNLKGADFSRSDLSKAIFTSSVLENAIFNNAKLRKTNFSGANLKNANFENAELGETSFDKAALTGAKGLDGKEFKWTPAYMPDGTESQAPTPPENSSAAEGSGLSQEPVKSDKPVEDISLAAEGSGLSSEPAGPAEKQKEAEATAPEKISLPKQKSGPRFLPNYKGKEPEKSGTSNFGGRLKKRFKNAKGQLKESLTNGQSSEPKKPLLIAQLENFNKKKLDGNVDKTDILDLLQPLINQEFNKCTPEEKGQAVRIYVTICRKYGLDIVLTNKNFDNVDLEWVDFVGARLHDSSFKGAKINNLKLRDAKGANLTGAHGVAYYDYQLEEVSSETKLVPEPNNINYKEKLTNLKNQLRKREEELEQLPESTQRKIIEFLEENEGKPINEGVLELLEATKNPKTIYITIKGKEKLPEQVKRTVIGIIKQKEAEIIRQEVSGLLEAAEPTQKRAILTAYLEIYNKEKHLINLEGLPLSGGNYAGMNFSGLNLQSVNFSKTNLQKCIFNSTSLANAIFTNANLKGSSFKNVSLKGAKFKNSNLTGCSFEGISCDEKTIVTDAKLEDLKGSDKDIAKITKLNEQSAPSSSSSKVADGRGSSEAASSSASETPPAPSLQGDVSAEAAARASEREPN